MDPKNPFPVRLGQATGTGMFVGHGTRNMTKQRRGSRFVLTQDATALNQRRGFGFSAWLGGVEPYQKAVTKNLKTARTTHTVVNFVLRTKTIYYDGDAVGAWVWTTGPGFGGIQSQQVGLVLTRIGGGGGAKTLACGWVWSAEGRNCVARLAQADWFSDKEDVSVSVRAEIKGTQHRSISAQTLTLAKKRKAGVVHHAGFL